VIENDLIISPRKIKTSNVF